MSYDLLARLAVLAVKVFGSITFPVLNAWREKQRQFRSERWVMIYGQIRSAQVISQWELYTASVSYAYIVNGQNYPGFLQVRFAWKNLADKYVARFWRGMVVTVRYDP